MRSVTEITEAMGNDSDTNFKSYARFKKRKLEEVYDLVEL